MRQIHDALPDNGSVDSAVNSWVLPALVLAAVPAAVRCQRSPVSGPASLAQAAGLVLAWCMLGGAILGALGALGAVAVWAWLGVGVGLSGFAALGGFSLRAWLAGFRGEAAAGWIAAPLAGILALACVPPWYRDSLVYHLALPRHFARHGGFAWPDDNLFAAFPLGWESALSLLFAVGGAPDFEPPFNPRLAGAWTLGAAALATYALARSAGARPGLAGAAGALLLLLPTAVEFGSSAYVENALLLFGTLALGSVLRARDGEAAWWTSALWAGLAGWVKYPACALLAFLAVAAPRVECLRRGENEVGPGLRRALGWGALAGLVACPFYLRNWIWRGNPIFPTGYALFGGSGWDEWRAWAYGQTLAHYGHGREWIDYGLLPWRLFSQRGLDGGFEGSLGPLLILGPVLAAWLWREAPAASPLRRQAPLLLAWTLWISIFWALTVQQARFYLIAVPALLTLLALALSQVRWGAGRWRSTGIAVALLAAQLAWSLPSLRQLWERQATSAWLAGEIDRDAVLARMLPETWPATRELPEWVPAEGRVWLVWMRGYTYYLPREVRLDSVFEGWRLEALLDEHAEARGFAAALGREGISHLLVNHRFFLAHGNADLRPGRTELLQGRFAAVVEDGALRPVQRWGPIALYAVRPGADHACLEARP